MDTQVQEENAEQDQTFLQKIRAIKSANELDRAEIKNNLGFKDRTLRKLGGAALLAAFVYEFGPGNETASPILVGQLMDHVGSSSSLQYGAAVGLGIGLFTVAQQWTIGKMTNYVARHYPRTAREMSGFVAEEEGEKVAKPFNKLSAFKQWRIASFLGSFSAVARERFMAVPDAEESHYDKVNNRSSLIVGGSVAALAGVSTAAIHEFDGTAVADGTEYVITNPYIWLGLGTYIMGRDILRDFRASKRSQPQQSAPADQ